MQNFKMIVKSENPNTERALDLAIAMATKSSKRAGFGWVLLNDIGVPLAHDGTIAGLNTSGLVESIKKHSERLNNIILTADPCNHYCNVEALIRAIETSNCMQITIARALPEATNDLRWGDWSDSWPGQVCYPQRSFIADNLTAGIRSLLSKGRPWLTAISASTIENHTISLIQLAHEFGFQSYINNLARQNRIILFSSSQRAIIEHLPNTNSGGERIAMIEVNKQMTVAAALDYCSDQKYLSALLFCDPNELSEYAEKELVDEIDHHIAMPTKGMQNMVDTPEFLRLNNWVINSCEIVGNSIRVNIRNSKVATQQQSKSRHRLN